jgi:hypothetical protein
MFCLAFYVLALIGETHCRTPKEKKDDGYLRLKRRVVAFAGGTSVEKHCSASLVQTLSNLHYMTFQYFFYLQSVVDFD